MYVQLATRISTTMLAATLALCASSAFAGGVSSVGGYHTAVIRGIDLHDQVAALVAKLREQKKQLPRSFGRQQAVEIERLRDN